METRTPNMQQHRQIMFDILQYIYNSSLATKLAFKWWTLCMFLHWLERFSVDLDFDLKVWDKEEVLNFLEKELLKYWKITDKKNSKIVLNYSNGNIPLKIEINDRIQKNDKYEKTMFFWIPILAMDKPSMFANKLYAIYQRKEITDKTASRDLFDIWFFFKNHREINHELLEERSGKSTNEYLSFLKDFIPANFNKDNLLLWLGQLITDKQKQFVKTQLIQEVLSQIDFYIRNNSFKK